MSEGTCGEEEESPFEFDDSDCEAERARVMGKGSTMAPEQLDKARWRDVCTISKVNEPHV